MGTVRFGEAHISRFRRTFTKEGNMDHNESVRKFEHLMLKQADHAHDAALN